MRRRRKKIQFKSLIFLFVISLFCFSLGYSLLEQNLTVTGKGTLVLEDTNSDDFKYSYTENSWESSGKTSKQYNFTILNIKSTPFIGWTGTIQLTEGDSISGCWNVICELKGTTLYLQNESYNANVPLNGEVTFGIIILHTEKDGTLGKISFSGITEEQENPEDPVTPTDPEDPDDPTNPTDPEDPDDPTDPGDTSDTIQVSITKGSSWGNGTNYTHIIDVFVKNTGDTAITSWQIDFVRKENYSINSASSANYIEMTEVLRFSNMDYNGTISPGESVQFQILLNTPTSTCELVVAQVSGSR